MGGCDLVEGFGGEDYAGDAGWPAIWRSISAASASISRHRASVSIRVTRPAARSASLRAMEAAHPSGKADGGLGA